VYAAPPSVEAGIFATVPHAFHKPGTNNWIQVQLNGAAAPVFLEGPAFDRAGNLWVVDIPWGRLFKIAPDGSMTCAYEYDGHPNGLAFHKDGRLFIADAKNGILALDPVSGKLETIVNLVLQQPFRGVNDLTFASNGDLYFTDQGQTGWHDPTGKVYRLRADDGRLECLINTVPSPNGLVLNKAETILYLAVTRDNAVWRLPLVKGGLVTKVGVQIQMSGGTGPDGLAMDDEDNMLICHTGLGSIWQMSAVGEPMLRIRAPHNARHTTNCAFGGPDNKRLFITEGDNILFADLPVPGRALFSHQ
jgi:gluconolactonase